MKNIRFTGWALLLSAAIGLVGSIWFGLLNEPNSAPLVLIFLLGGLLLIAGLPGIQNMQPRTGRPGQLGLGLMALGAAIAVVANLVSLLGGSGVGEVIPAISAVAGILGRLIVGWLTFRAGVFPDWTGWLLIVSAVLNVLAGVFPGGAAFLGPLTGLVDAVAIGGYGYTIIRRYSTIYSHPV